MIDDLFSHDFMALHLLEVVYCVCFYPISARFIRFVCGFVFFVGFPGLVKTDQTHDLTFSGKF